VQRDQGRTAVTAAALAPAVKEHLMVERERGGQVDRLNATRQADLELDGVQSGRIAVDLADAVSQVAGVADACAVVGREVDGVDGGGGAVLEDFEAQDRPAAPAG